VVETQGLKDEDAQKKGRNSSPVGGQKSDMSGEETNGNKNGAASKEWAEENTVEYETRKKTVGESERVWAGDEDRKGAKEGLETD